MKYLGRPEVRRILRNRARYEVVYNSYAKGIVLTLTNDVIGTGSRLPLLSDQPETNRRVEYESARSATTTSLLEKKITSDHSRMSQGFFGSSAAYDRISCCKLAFSC